jgi:predicted LPLAT superfamily acyltransferase
MLVRKRIPLGSGLTQEVRLFSDSTIQKHINDALMAVGPDKKGAVLNVRLDQDKAVAVMAARLNNNWSMGLIVERSHAGDFSGGAQVAFEW